MAKQILAVDRLNFSYDEEASSQTLKDINFEVAAGEWVGIIGHNGSGKSTLAKLIDGLLEANSGTITVDGIALTEETLWDVRARIGLVFQNPDNQFVGATVEDDVAFGLENAGIPHDEMVEKVEAALCEVDMWDFRDKEPGNLSGGQKQRVALAGVMALQPKLIILDEAMSMLDPEGRREVMQVIRRLKERNHLTIISITHDLTEATAADRLILLSHGEVVQQGTPDVIFKDAEALIERGLLLPFPERVKRALKQVGIAVPEAYLTEESLVSWLCQ
ncbi:MAG: energy-coupling factor ABC transporter ATP-binding protein [Aerococcus sp.]|nr:energy-coupling factor ABC transporter ATP-binding protein [Aerococcus sp.]